ncbi:MAG: hypothetical protein AMJ60_10020 [Desulfobacterales bacterium SG8_35]|nr:MAG: hypothetical protein AMJ60_10020 [Desulfobacterales bacterium SG8_35]
MFEESEIINLILGLVSLVIVFYEIRKRTIPHFHLFFAGFVCVVMARIFTVVEGVFLGGILNILEHLCYAFSALLFAVGCISLSKKRSSELKR